MTPFQKRLSGNIPAILTALDKDYCVDREAMRRIVRRLVDHGCRGLVVLGTTGEFANIDDDQRTIAIRTVVDEVAGRIPVIVGCGHPNVSCTRQQLRAAGELGADGVLVVPPFYFTLTQDELVRYFADLVRVSPRPVLIYNIPRLTKVAVEPATVPRLRDVGVEGIKDSSGCLATTLASLGALGPDSDFRIIYGADTVFLHLLDAGVCATTGIYGNIAPQLAVGIHQAWQDGDYQTGFALQRRAIALFRAFSTLHEFPPSAAKAVLSKVGIMERWVAPPKTAMSDAEAAYAFDKVREFLPEFE